tara:strand:- start:4899 stop:5099 length:201 start_codon:yes stop_codon:yes gene_type:complete
MKTKTNKVTRLSTGVATQTDKKGRIHVYSKDEVINSSSDIKEALRFLLSLATMGGIGLALAYFLDK